MNRWNTTVPVRSSSSRSSGTGWPGTVFSTNVNPDTETLLPVASMNV